MVAKPETFLGSLEDLRAFCAVIDFGTISEAARQLGETKGSVSRRVSRLEKTIGATLLARTPRAVRPSDEGREFYDKATLAISLLDEATEETRKARTVLRGAIRITAPIDFAVEVLPEVIATFRREHPQITVEILATDAVLDLTANRADLALRVGLGRLPDMGYHAAEIADIKIGRFAAPAYLASRTAPGIPQDLDNHDMVLPRERPGLTHLSLTDGTREEKVALRPVVRASDFASVLRLVVAGAGVAPLPTILTRKWIKDGSLVRLLPAWSWSGLTLHAVSPPGRQLTARVRAFRDHVRRMLAP